MQIIKTQESIKPFYTPLTYYLVKGDEDNPYIAYIEASNEIPDSQKDVVFMKALADERESFLKKGIISWDHLHKIDEKSPEYIIGEPLEVKFKADRTFVKVLLYKGVKYADSVVKLLRAKTTRLGASIGGFIKSREKLNKTLSGITKVLWDEVAITYKPINDTTLGNVTLMPIGAFAKALMVGDGVDPSSFTGGRVLVGESLQGAKKKRKKKAEEIISELMWRIEKGDVRTDDDFKDFLDYMNIPQAYGVLGKTIIRKFNN